ncbi:hypothetical protein IMSAGC018_02355 [Lachnospiraceae bacterium]|nr:hypothetical protein IMSAGC018_02355 [Lachnospiraceae bacterium]
MKIDDLYYQNVQATTGYNSNASKAAAVDKAAQEQNKDAVNAVDKKNSQANTDRVEFSKDTKVTNKMSDAERASLVQSLKADLDNQMARFTNMMTQMFQKQGITGVSAQGDDMWRRIASGNFTVDAQTKAEAQQAISEDGYWGVKQTSQRIFDFAYALAGDNPEKMKEMQAAVEKGFEEATKSWGKSLPSISQETHSAIGDLFDSYYEKAGVSK